MGIILFSIQKSCRVTTCHWPTATNTSEDRGVRRMNGAWATYATQAIWYDLLIYTSFFCLLMISTRMEWQMGLMTSPTIALMFANAMLGQCVVFFSLHLGHDMTSLCQYTNTTTSNTSNDKQQMDACICIYITTTTMNTHPPTTLTRRNSCHYHTYTYTTHQGLETHWHMHLES